MVASSSSLLDIYIYGREEPSKVGVLAFHNLYECIPFNMKRCIVRDQATPYV